MKQDSLLSNLSNLVGNTNRNSDFFHEQTPLGYFHEIKIHQDKQQEQINLNSLETFAQIDSHFGNNNNFLAAGFWNVGSDLVSKNQQNLSEFGQSDLEIEEALEKIREEVKVQQTEEKKECQRAEESYSSEGPIGTVVKNETKNIPKNYGKAIISFIQKQKVHFMPILDEYGIRYKDLMDQLNKRKKSINTIANLRDLWVDFKYSKCMRVLSNQFFRKYALQYIFNSRISNFTSHVKYRKRLQEAIQTPLSFCHIKQY